MKSRWKFILAGLGLFSLSLWLAVFTLPDKNLHLIACDVGQGDAILLTLDSTQILIDGGPNNSVLDCLGENMPFWDRKIELVVLSHPQKDHFMGLIDVFKRYKVDTVLASGLDSSTQGYQVLKKEAGGSGARVVTPDIGTILRLGLMELEVVWPAFAKASAGGPRGLGTFTSNQDPNDFSIVLNLKLVDFDALFTGDIGPKVTPKILETGRIRHVNYLKVPHHGSKNGLTEELLEQSKPEIAVISVGKNQWGHPHQEVLEMLADYGLRVFRTDLDGNVEIVTDGQDWWIP